MQTPPAFSTPPPVPKRTSWWSRNWKWFVPVITLAVVLIVGFVVGIFALVFGIMKSSDAYKMAVLRASNSPQVVAAIGRPIKEGTFTAGSIHVTNETGEANLIIPISGPKGQGNIHVGATKSGSMWTFYKLYVVVDGSGQQIDLLELGEQSPPASGDPQ